MADELKTMDVEPEREAAELLDKARGFLRGNIMSIGVALICAVFITTAILRPEKTDITLEEVILNSILAFVTSMGLNSLYTSMALRDGLIKTELVTSIESYGHEVDDVLEGNRIEELDAYCKKQNELNYRKQRTRILSAAGLTYEECFDEAGNPKEVTIHVPKYREMRGVHWRLKLYRRRHAKKQIKAFTKACTLRLAEITADELLGEDGNSRNPFKLGRRIPVFRGQSVSKDVVSKSFTGIGLGLYGAAMIADFQWIKLASMIFQVVVFNIFGILKYLSTVNYVTEEYNGRLTKMTRILGKFRKEANVKVHEVSRELGNPNHEGAGASPTDRELHATASANI